MSEFLYPDKWIENTVQFLKKTYKTAQKKTGLIAVSGGIDSALSLTLLTKAIGREHVHAVLLPYDKQDMADAEQILKWNKIPAQNIQVINIKPVVDGVVKSLAVDQDGAEKNAKTEAIDSFRLGNIMARARMIILFDQAKKLDALVCGTENKSEKYLGYFTRFGDEASDIEPLLGFYKTELRALAEHLKLPPVFLKKSPSAGLWKNQTDETELGFSYQVADQVFEQLIEKQSGLLYMKLIEGNRVEEVADAIHEQLPELSKKLITAVLQRVQSQQFKHEVPFTVE